MVVFNVMGVQSDCSVSDEMYKSGSAKAGPASSSIFNSPCPL